MKKWMLGIALSALSLGLVTLAACGGDPGTEGGTGTTYTYTQTADDGVTVTAVQGEVTVQSGGTLSADEAVTVTATSESGSVQLYVNETYQESPYTFTPAEDVTVRAELYYTVTVKIENPNHIVGRNITLKQDNNRINNLPASLQYPASVRAGKTVTFTASAAGFRDAVATVVADGDKTVTLTLDQFRMEGAAYSNVTEREVDGKIEYDLNTYDSKGKLLNPYVYKGFTDNNWVMSFKVKNISTGQETAGDGEHDPRYGTISVGAVISYKHDGDYVTMDLRWEPMASAEPKAGYQAISFGGAAWGIVQSTFESEVDPIAIINETLADPEKAISLEYIRSGSVVYMLVNGVYCASVNLTGFPNAVSDHTGATSFGLFARCSDCTVFDLETARGAEAVAARLDEVQITLPTPEVTGEGCSVTVPTGKVFAGQRIEADIVAAQDYMLESLTYGGEDVKGQVQGTKFSFYADENKKIVAVFERAPLTVTGHIDVKTYSEQIPYTAIRVSGGAATVNSDYNYSIAVKPGTEVNLTFTAEGFSPATVSFTAQDTSGPEAVIDEPILDTQWASAFSKTGDNEYTVAAGAVGTYAPTNYQSVHSKHFVIESKVTITTPGPDAAWGKDYGIGYTTYGSASILVTTVSDVWYLEIIYDNPSSWVNQRQPLSADLSAKMVAAVAGTPVMLKMVRSDNVLAFFIDGEYAGSFLTDEFVGINELVTNQTTTVGLYIRGGVACKFEKVWYNLNQANAQSLVSGLEAVNGEKAITCYGMTSEDGKVTSDGSNAQFVTGVIDAPSSVWAVETKISNVESKNGWQGVYFGILIHGWTNSGIEIVNTGSEVGIRGFNLTPQHDGEMLPLQNDVDINEVLKKAATADGIVLKVVRYYNDFFVYIDDVLAAKVNLSAFTGDYSNAAGHSFGFITRANTACVYSEYSYSVDRLAVLDYIENA